MSREPALLSASRDDETGEIYIPPRTYAADGSLRRCTETGIPGVGTLVGWTVSDGEQYGLVVLDAGPRLQVLLSDEAHAYGERYVGVEADEEVRFFRA
ncbi:hypothetical protein [Streptosporangium sp. NPDC051022]|uniref:hypothetical protein n=1 Tax=Streptosporangium sp. NPDC051022 TaxID=3155752 RepID=UPI00344920DE